MVAVQRLRGDRCQHMSGSGRLGSRRNCSDRNWIRAHGKRRWRLDIERRLPRGHYRLHRRAVDAAGNRERAHHRHLWIR